jgi:hypothetical protein
MIDVTRELTMSLADAAKLPILPRRRGGKPPHATTLLRWATTGVRGVRLEVVRWGTTLCTSEEALLRFSRALSEPLSDPAIPQKRRASAQETERILAAAGI